MKNSEFIDDRLRFLDIDKETVAQIRQAKKLLEPHLDEMLDRFYEHILESPRLRNLFTDESSIERARAAQKNHWSSTIFDGSFDGTYFDKTREIGLAHARVGLTPSWYIGGYCQMLGQFTDAIMREESVDKETLSGLARAIQKAVFLDMDLVIHCYLDAKDDVMRDILERTTNFTDDATRLSTDIANTAKSMRNRVDQVADSEPELVDLSRALSECASQLLTQTESLSTRLDDAKTADRLYITAESQGTGTLAKLKALFYSGTS